MGVSSEFRGTKTMRTVTQRITESASKKESSSTLVRSTSVSSEIQSKTNQDGNAEVVEQDPKSTIDKEGQGDIIQAENQKELSKKETTASRKDDADGGLKSSLLNNDKKEIVKSDKSEEDSSRVSNTQKEQEESLNWRGGKYGVKGLQTNLLDDKSEKNENVSISAVIEVAKSTVTKVIEDAQKKVAEDKPIKTSMEDDTMSDPKGDKATIAETNKRPDKEKRLDWKDDKDGAEGLKAKLMDEKLEDNRDAVVDVMTVAKETVTKVIKDAKQKVTKKSADITTTIEDDGKKDKKDAATEKDEASRESIPDWRDDKDGAQGLKSKLLHKKSDKESGEESGVKSDPSKLEKNGKQEDGNTKQEHTVEKVEEAIPNTNKEVDIKSEVGTAPRDNNVEEGENADHASSKEAALNWRDEKGGIKGLKATLLDGKAEKEGAVGNEALISAAKETVTKVIEDAKQKVSEAESSRTVSTEGKIEIDVNEKGEEEIRSPEKEPAEQTLNWRDDKDGAKGLKTMLEDEKGDSNKSVQEETEIDMMATFVGVMKIKIHQAKDLEKKDLVQKADPYVVIRFGSKESKSDKVKNSLTPVWNYETTIDLQRASPRMIETQLMDWERIGKDEPMGKLLLPVGEAVKKSGKGSFWMDLQACKSGKILISTEFNGSDAKTVIGGGVKELRGMLQSDKNTTESDEKTLEPKEGLSPAKAENDEEESKQQTDDPTGNKNAKKEKKMNKEKEEERAQAEAEQKSAATIAAEEAAAAKAVTYAADITTRIAAEETVTVKTGDMATDIGKRKKEQDVKQESQPNKTQKKDTDRDKHCVQYDLFHLYIHKARNLENKDILGKSDPYIHVRFGSKEVRSATVDNTLNPEWQFHTDFATDDTSPTSVEIKIFDDDFGKSEPLGKLTLDLEGYKKGEEIQHKWLPLDDAASGEVQVSLLSKELSDVQLRIAAEGAVKIAAEETARIAAEEAARIAVEEAARIAAEEATRFAAEEAARIVAEEAAKIATEEAARLAAEEAATIAAAEAAKIAAEEAASIAAKEAARKAAEEAARIAAEEAAAAEEARLVAEETAAAEAARIAAEEATAAAAAEAAIISAEQAAAAKASRMTAEEAAAAEAARITAEEAAAAEAIRLAAEEAAAAEAA